MNNIQLIGRLTKKPELRYTKNDKEVCNFDIAVKRIGSDNTDFINVYVYGNQAKNLSLYQDKGNLIAVIGALRVDKYQNEKGENRYITYVLASNIEYLSSKSKENNEVKSSEEKLPNDVFEQFGENIEISDEELPF